MNIENAQVAVDDWIKEHGVRYFNELINMAQLTEEVGEVARIIVRRYGEQSEKESDKNKDLGEELANILFVVLCLANQTGVGTFNIQTHTDPKGQTEFNLQNLFSFRYLLFLPIRPKSDLRYPNQKSQMPHYMGSVF